MPPEIAILLLLAAVVGGAVTVAVLEARARARRALARMRRVRRSIRPHIALTDHSLESRGRGRRR